MDQNQKANNNQNREHQLNGKGRQPTTNLQHKSPKPDTKQGICDKQSATQILTASK